MAAMHVLQWAGRPFGGNHSSLPLQSANTLLSAGSNREQSSGIASARSCLTCCQLKEAHAQAPDIHLLTHTPLHGRLHWGALCACQQQHLWGHVKDGAHWCSCRSFMVKHCQVKVAQFGVSLAVHEDVLQLYVAVGDSSSMHAGQRAQQWRSNLHATAADLSGVCA